MVENGSLVFKLLAILMLSLVFGFETEIKDKIVEKP